MPINTSVLRGDFFGGLTLQGNQGLKYIDIIVKIR